MDGREMLFSVVIPVYNVEKYIKECLDSIIPQAKECREGCEIILVDDGSTDSSGEICDQYEKSYPQLIKVFHKQNEGLLLTRRYGYKRSVGDYIINCDSDDLLEPDMLKSVCDLAHEYNNPDIILINHNIYDNGKRTVAFENIFTEESNCRVDKQALLREFMLRHSIVSVCGKIVKCSCINTDKDYASFGRISTGEDTLQSIEFFSNAKTCVYLNKRLYNYRCGSGMTGKFDDNYYFTFKCIFEELKKQKAAWGLNDFDELFAVKVLQTAGRAITQSRYKKWSSIKEHKNYLEKLNKDEMLKYNLHALDDTKGQLQKDHVVLLKLLKCKMYLLIIAALWVKNRISEVIK